jgi:radical SAM superfamily enzyme YgiQ (UPF0313 family)
VTSAHPVALSGSSKRYGTGKHPKAPIEKPLAYEGFPRTYYRYGIHPESLGRRLVSISKPDLIWVTSIMTYWHPGVQQTTAVLRDAFPEAPIWLGGIYAQLCTSHAMETSGADRVVTSATATLPDLLEAATGYSLKNKIKWHSFCDYPAPALDLVGRHEYAPILTSLGCPFSCSYCASKLLQPHRVQRSADTIFEEIMKWRREYDICDFAFYDDALLLHAETTLRPVLEKICRDGVHLRFHTPNALHIRALTPQWCELLYASGFTTLRLGLETTSIEKQRKWGGKVETEMFFEAVDNLREAGFSGNEIGVYLLCGLPGQSTGEVAEAIRTVKEAGAQPFLAEYSPLPGTAMWPEAVALSPYDIENEPLYHNNSFFACRRPDFTYEDLLALKETARQARHSVRERCLDHP